MVCRNRATGELAFYHCYTPTQRTGRPGEVAGRRWRVEACFQTGKGSSPP
jgi:hypothetical protein